MDFTRAYNTFKSYMDLLFRRARPRAYPSELSLGTSSQCNLRCIMCPREEHEGNLMPFNDRVDMDYIRSFGPHLRRAREVSLFGLGEPLIDKRYFDMVRFVREQGAEVSLSTNGTLLDEARCEAFFETGVRQIGVSIDAVTPEMYERIRPPGGLTKILENLRRFVKMRQERGLTRPRLVVSFAMMRPNLHEAERFPELAASLGADEVVLHNTIYMSRKMREELAPDPQQVETILVTARERAEELGIPFMSWPLDSMTYLRSLQYVKEQSGDSDADLSGILEQEPAVPKNGTEPGHPAFCHFLWRNVMVQGGGEVFPCCYMTNHRLGTLGEGVTLDGIRTGEFMAGLREAHFRGESPGPCAGCPQMVPWKPKEIVKGMLRETWGYLK